MDKGAVIRRYERAVANRLNAFARERGYDGIAAACSYLGSRVPGYRADALRCVELRDGTWETFYGALAGDGGAPELEDVLAALPKLEWPEEAL